MAAVYFLPITRPMERRACAVILLASGQILLNGRITGAPPPKTLPLRVRIPPYYTLLWAHLSPHPNDLSISASVLAQLVVISNRQTDRQTETDHGTSVTIGSNFALCACDAA